MSTKLTDLAIKKAKPKPSGKPHKKSDGAGLFILIKPSGKYWRYAYRYNGKQKTLALGVYPAVSLADARELHAQARQSLASGVDPKVARDRARLEVLRQEANTFALVSENWREYKLSHRKWSESHTQSVDRILKRDVLPWMGNRPINDIEAPEVLQVLRRMEKRVGDSTRKARQIIGQIFRHGVETGYCQRDPTADLKNAIQQPPAKHYAAITDPARFGELLRAIDRYGGQYATTQALKFASLVMTRPQNVRAVEWSEIDREGRVWHVPANKIKLLQPLKDANRPEDAQIVPLSRQALAILEDIEPLTGHFKYVFYSSGSKSGMISENTMNNAIKNMGFGGEMTAHGFRTTSSTMLNEAGIHRPDVVEAALFHKETNQVRAAYNRAQYLEERREMLQAWADYLDELREGAQVMSINQRRAK